MSLLDQGRHTVTVYPTVSTTDGDGNPVQKPGQGYTAQAVVQPISSTEENEMGVLTGEMYRLRFVRPGPELQPGAQIEWMCRRWAIHGYPKHHTGSDRTAHLEYRIRRA